MSSILGIYQHLRYHRQALDTVPLVVALASDMASPVVALAFASAALAKSSDDVLVGGNSNNAVPVASCAFAVDGNSDNVVPVAFVA